MSDLRPTGRRPGRVGTLVNGKWRLDARLGSGGMATVYAATHRNGHRAAIKMLHAQLSRDPDTRARFLREGYVANAVGHEGVVRVEDDGVAEDGSAFLILELLEGETLDARRIARGGALPIEEVLDVADQSLAALAAAHAKGIVHRDIKPENVFVTNDGRVKLLDFGLARMKDAHADITKTGVTIGTPEFMPPEQAMGRKESVDARSDVWGLGATLFTSITGEYVHEGNTVHELLIASATRRARPLRRVAPHVSIAVARVIDKALELESADRWASAVDMQAALADARGGQRGFATTTETMTFPMDRPLDPENDDTVGVFDAVGIDDTVALDSDSLLQTQMLPAARVRPPSDPEPFGVRPRQPSFPEGPPSFRPPRPQPSSPELPRSVRPPQSVPEGPRSFRPPQPSTPEFPRSVRPPQPSVPEGPRSFRPPPPSTPDVPGSMRPRHPSIPEAPRSAGPWGPPMSAPPSGRPPAPSHPHFGSAYPPPPSTPNPLLTAPPSSGRLLAPPILTVEPPPPRNSNRVVVFMVFVLLAVVVILGGYIAMNGSELAR